MMSYETFVHEYFNRISEYVAMPFWLDISVGEDYGLQNIP